MFEATSAFAFFDYFRIPYRIVSFDAPAGRHALRVAGTDGPLLTWPSGGGELGRQVVDGIPIYAHLTGAAPRRETDGGVALPFDPGEVMWRYWSEHYGDRSRARAALVRLYYLLRPLIPRPLQIRLRQAFTRVQEQATFPAFPVETALHDFHEWMFQLVASFAGRPVPWLDLWPGGHAWAFVLTHDVETADGLANIEVLREIERAAGQPSSWNFVPLRYETPDEVRAALRDEGCEVGVHGLRHDGRDLGSRRLLRRRLPAIRSYAERWQAAGFRSPATQRTWEWMPSLGFAYDSSYHDTAPYEPRPGGSCSYLPYFVGSPGGPGDMVELPITLPMDHTLFTILEHPDATLWLDKAAHLRDRGGMALILTHPDYAGDPRVTDGYRQLLDKFHDDPTVWRALPCEVAQWWQRRATSTPHRDAAGWTVRGPAADDATVRMCRPGTPALGSTRSRP
jgi:peptidoglycan/xylan/chitin deacetylase (PgdA/CDA1 family)